MIKLQGVKELNAKLKDLENKVQKQIARKGLREGAKITLSAARSLAPKESGQTENSLKVRAGKSSKGLVSIVVGLAQKWFTGSTFYAAFVIFGHRIGPRRLGDARKLQPANDFLKRANDSTKDEAAQKAVDTMLDLYKQEIN